MLTPEKKAILENAADLLEQSGHVGANVLRELIRDNRLEVLTTFLLYGGYLFGNRSPDGGLTLVFDFREQQSRLAVTPEQLRSGGVEPIVAASIQRIDDMEDEVGQRLCEKGERPLADCLDNLATRGCPRCHSLATPSFDPDSLLKTCVSCGYRVQVPPEDYP